MGDNFEVQFLRNYKGSTQTLVFPNVEDIEDVKKENIIRSLKIEAESLGKIIFNM